MKQTTDPITTRINWCRRQIAQARTEPEEDGWRAEEDGLRDALLNRDHTEDYRSCPPEIRDRYMLGFRDGTALRRTARVERTTQNSRTQNPAPRVEQHDLPGDEG